MSQSNLEWVEISEAMVRGAAEMTPPDSPFNKVVAEADEILSRGHAIRFMLNSAGEIAVQEGIEVTPRGDEPDWLEDWLK